MSAHGWVIERRLHPGAGRDYLQPGRSRRFGPLPSARMFGRREDAKAALNSYRPDDPGYRVRPAFILLAGPVEDGE